MAVKVKMYPNRGQIEGNVWLEDSFENQEVTFNNMTFHYGPNQTRNFADDGVGLGFTLAASGIVQDTIPFGDSTS